jgi:SAM-dependent methyltransferase
VTNHRFESVSLDPIHEVIGLLRTSSASPKVSTESGYIDTLGPEEALGPYMIHQMCRSKLLTRIYERWWRPMTSRLLFGRARWKMAEEERIALQMFRLSPGDRVLDIACGPGNYARRFSPATEGGLIVGLDASAEMLEAAVREGGENLVYVRGDAVTLPFEDASFDAACCLGALHMFDEPIKALGEMSRVISPGGRLLVLTTLNPKSKDSLLSRTPGLRIFGRDELTDALEDCGLVEVQQCVTGREQFVSAHKPVD